MHALYIGAEVELNIAPSVTIPTVFCARKCRKRHFGHDFSGENEIADLEGEEWKVIPGFDDRYLISTHGRVKAVNVRYEGEKLMKPNLKKQKGELSISLSGVNKKMTTPISNLMVKVFLDNPHGHKMVIHLDGDKENNHVSNLKWVHNSEAQKTAIDLGLKPILWGEENASSVAVHQYTADGMRFIWRWGCMMDVERELGIPPKVCLGEPRMTRIYRINKMWVEKVEELWVLS